MSAKAGFLLLLLLAAFPAFVQAGCSLKSGSTVKATDTIDISTLLNTQSSYAETRTGTWTIPVGCFALTFSNAVHFVSPIKNGFYVKFINVAGAARWVKFQTSGYTDVVNYGNGDTTLSGGNLSYTLTATLLPADPGVTDSKYYTVTQSGSASIVTMVLHNANIFGATPSEDTAAGVVASGSWNNDYLGYQSLTVTFNPKETTCEMPDQTVTMPRVSLTDLRDGRDVGRTAVELPVSCSNTLAGVATRAVNAWLTSADLVDSNKQIMRNNASSSSGVGIVLSTSAALPITLSDSTASGTGATSLLTISSGAGINNSAINLNAAYKIYDQSNLRPGTVVATATLYFDYD
ncbi:fimbrial protein [Pantoea sp. BAV 3049]|uniref:fimbrial protein n=1 Tax=Pantoea sp. BAV 3049 TaxID=2654188 RepID=UPI00131AE23E|nr:fimbrial protein [Pantoea sp. BAV 3049]